MTDARFERISIEVKEESRDVIAQWMPGSGAEDFVVSANITAYKAGSTQHVYCQPTPEPEPEPEPEDTPCAPDQSG